MINGKHDDSRVIINKVLKERRYQSMFGWMREDDLTDKLKK